VILSKHHHHDQEDMSTNAPTPPKKSNYIFSASKILVHFKKKLNKIIDKKIGIFDTKKNVQNFLYGMQSISEVKAYRNSHKNCSLKFPHIIVVNLD
jgi:hypothetical protein